MIKRVAIGVYSDGFIHAGNLAYLALVSLFPFVIVTAAMARLAGPGAEGMSAVNAVLETMPHDVQQVLRAPIADVMHARAGNLVWFGALVGLWTTASFIETIRDIIRRAYGVTFSRPFWEYRLGSIGIIIASVLMAMIAFSASVLLSGVQQFIVDWIPATAELISAVTLIRIVPALLLFGSLYLLFYILTPKRYRKGCRKWPGAAFVAIWWVATTALLPVILSGLGGYGATYGSLAGVMIALGKPLDGKMGRWVVCEPSSCMSTPCSAMQYAIHPPYNAGRMTWMVQTGIALFTTTFIAYLRFVKSAA